LKGLEAFFGGAKLTKAPVVTGLIKILWTKQCFTLHWTSIIE